MSLTRGGFVRFPAVNNRVNPSRTGICQFQKGHKGAKGSRIPPALAETGTRELKAFIPGVSACAITQDCGSLRPRGAFMAETIPLFAAYAAGTITVTALAVTGWVVWSWWRE